jgi:hypothetical protein
LIGKSDFVFAVDIRNCLEHFRKSDTGSSQVRNEPVSGKE